MSAATDAILMLLCTPFALCGRFFAMAGTESLGAALRMINGAIGILQMEIRGGVDQRDGSVWYGLVNRAADKQAKLGTSYSHAQLQLFRAIVSLPSSCFPVSTTRRQEGPTLPSRPSAVVTSCSLDLTPVAEACSKASSS